MCLITANRAWAVSSWPAIMSLTSASNGVSGRRMSSRRAGTSGAYLPARAIADSAGPGCAVRRWPGGRRNTVERCFSKLKQFRAVALSYDKRERIYQGTNYVASLRIWLRDPVP